MLARRRKRRYALLAIFTAALCALIAWGWYDSSRGARYIQYYRLSYHAGSGIASFAWHPPLERLQVPWNNSLDVPLGVRPTLRWTPYPRHAVAFADPRVALTPMLMFWWFFAPALLVLFFCIWKLARRSFPASACQTCGYDLTGNVSGVCPECAAKAVTPSPSIKT